MSPPLCLALGVVFFDLYSIFLFVHAGQVRDPPWVQNLTHHGARFCFHLTIILSSNPSLSYLGVHCKTVKLLEQRDLQDFSPLQRVLGYCGPRCHKARSCMKLQIEDD